MQKVLSGSRFVIRRACFCELCLCPGGRVSANSPSLSPACGSRKVGATQRMTAGHIMACFEGEPDAKASRVTRLHLAA